MAYDGLVVEVLLLCELTGGVSFANAMVWATARLI